MPFGIPLCQIPGGARFAVRELRGRSEKEKGRRAREPKGGGGSLFPSGSLEERILSFGISPPSPSLRVATHPSEGERSGSQIPERKKERFPCFPKGSKGREERRGSAKRIPEGKERKSLACYASALRNSGSFPSGSAKRNLEIRRDRSSPLFPLWLCFPPFGISPPKERFAPFGLPPFGRDPKGPAKREKRRGAISRFGTFSGLWVPKER